MDQLRPKYPLRTQLPHAAAVLTRVALAARRRCPALLRRPTPQSPPARLHRHRPRQPLAFFVQQRSPPARLRSQRSQVVLPQVFGASYVPTPILVITDVQPKELGIPTKAYYAVEEVKECYLKAITKTRINGGINLQNATQKSQVFVHVPSEIAAHEVEEIGVEHLLRDVKDTTISTLATEVFFSLHQHMAFVLSGGLVKKL
nr:26S proteasome non-ATPase regulatory subunit 7 homolog A-like [Ipomoea trifida]